MRRLVSIPALLAATVITTALSPLIVALAWLVSFVPAYAGATRTALFLIGYLWCETIGLAALFMNWVIHRDGDRYLAQNRRIQANWAGALMSWGKRCYGLTFELHGAESLAGEAGCIVLPRHTSIADTVLPIIFYTQPHGLNIRYVMKQELLWDPCLDVAGNRIPNVFIDRSGPDSDHAKAQIQALAAEMSTNEALVFYPEGTRFSAEKRQRLIDSNKPISALAERWNDLLPPRLSGTLALLDANPGRDVLFVCHSGFEGSSHFSTLINGSWQGTRVHIWFWRVPFGQVPTEAAAQAAFINEHWERMQATLDTHNAQL